MYVEDTSTLPVDLVKASANSTGPDKADLAGIVDPVVGDLQRQLAAVRADLQRKREEIRDFKIAVRRRSFEGKLSENWCDAGFNAAMDDLGLPRYERQMGGYLTLQVPVRVDGTTDPYTAQDWVYAVARTATFTLTVARNDGLDD